MYNDSVCWMNEYMHVDNASESYMNTWMEFVSATKEVAKRTRTDFFELKDTARPAKCQKITNVYTCTSVFHCLNKLNLYI